MPQNGRSIGWSPPATEDDEGLVDGATTDCSEPDFARPSRAAADRAGVSSGHGAAVVGTEDELLAAALPFLDEGLRAGDLVALTCPPDTVALLSRELGEKAAAVESEPRISLLGARAPDALTMCRRYLERAIARGADGGSGRTSDAMEMAQDG